MKLKLIFVFVLLFVFTLLFADNVSTPDIHNTKVIDNRDYTPIADIQNDIDTYNGQTVSVKGIVTIGAGVIHNSQLKAYIQDESNRGIQIFAYDITSAYENDFVRGTEVSVTGKVYDFNNETTEIKDFTYEVVSTGNAEPNPVKISIGSASNPTYEGALIRLTGEVFDTYYAGGGWNLNIMNYNDPPDEITVRVWDSTGIDVDEFVVGYVLQVIGVGGIYNSDAQILPGYQDQLTAGFIQDYDFYELDPLEAVANEPVTITFSPEVSEEPYTRANIYWKTTEQRDFYPAEMDSVGANTFQYTFSGQQEGTKVSFYFRAYDSEDNYFLFPENAPTELASFAVKMESFKAKLNIPPKPFNPYAGEIFAIEFASEPGNKAILRLFDAEGKLVATPYNDFIRNRNGIVTVNWDGRDKNHQRLPLGLYIAYLEVIKSGSGSKKTAKAPIMIGAPLK